MKKAIFYLIALSIIYTAALGALVSAVYPALEPYRVGLTCAFIGGLGGCLYCLRGVYLNAAVKNQWSKHWEVWYYLRPITSLMCGGVSYLFLKAGLLVLESGTKPDASELGFYALAFIAGFNVNKFIKKLEDVSEAVWGIEKSRASSTRQEKDGK